ncbi:MAG TPA: site-specific DNA-methyltransferase [Firmicutes bacterium]|nr:site-specific DNA-methyltransferase [Candidatus Fermentithermobacillaceae bacterium]
MLKPGGHALVFAGTRTQDLMTISLRMAGFEIRDVIEWLYFSGFPKSLDVGKQFDKRKGGASFVHEFAKLIKKKRLEKGYSLAFMDKEVCGGTTNYSWFEGRPAGVRLPQLKEYYKIKELLDLDDTYDEMMEEAEREKIGEGTSGKTYAMGGLRGEQTGEGVYDITAPATDLAKKWDGWGTALKPAHEPIILARKPLDGTVAENVLKWGTGGLNIDGCRIPTEDNLNGGAYAKNGTPRDDGWGMQRGGAGEYVQPTGRFPANVILDEEAGRMLDEQSGMSKSVRSQRGAVEIFKKPNGWIGASTERGHDDSGGASRFFYVAKASKRERTHGGQVENNHPTVKPIKLMRYLCRLITPPGGTVLDPFAGSGTTLLAAIQEGFSCIGIEKEPEYCDIIRKRMAEVQPALPLVR